MAIDLEESTDAIKAISTTLGALNLDAEFPARGSGYTGYTSEKLTFWRLQPADKAKFLKHKVPLGDAHYASGAESWKEASIDLGAQWTAVFHAAIRDTFGREPEFNDYQVSGIGRSEFSEHVKMTLRALNSLKNQTQDLAFSLKLASGVHAQTARTWLQATPGGDSADETDEHEVAATEAPRA